MIDLTLGMKNLYKIKWVDGTVLFLKPPSQKLFLQIQEIQNIDTSEYEEVINTIYGIIGEIFNNNSKKEPVDVSELGLDTCMAVLQDYLNFYQEKMSQVVFQQSQPQKK